MAAEAEAARVRAEEEARMAAEAEAAHLEEAARQEAARQEAARVEAELEAKRRAAAAKRRREFEAATAAGVDFDDAQPNAP